MPVVQTVRSKGSTIVVEANAEVLFTRGGPVGNFTRVFTGRVKKFTADAAPGNKRPTWGHEPAAHGKPLKSTFKASTRYHPALLRVFSAVGSSASYSAFVDQGTGVFNGGSPWLAKILPPTSEGGSDLYEHTWRPGGGKGTTREVWIQGQRPQYFFARGLERAFKSMHIPTATVPGTAKLAGEVTSFPEDLANVVITGVDTSPGSAFMASLEQWRAQRDAAWNSPEARADRNSRARHDRSAARLAKKKSEAQRRAKRRAAAKRDAERPRPTDRTVTAAEKLSALKEAQRLRRQREDEQVKKSRAAAEAKKKREAAEAAKRRAKNALTNGNRKTRAEAEAFFNKIRQAHPDAKFQAKTLADGVILYQVSYRVGNEIVRQRWAHGYAT